MGAGVHTSKEPELTDDTVDAVDTDVAGVDTGVASWIWTTLLVTGSVDGVAAGVEVESLYRPSWAPTLIKLQTVSCGCEHA